MPDKKSGVDHMFQSTPDLINRENGGLLQFVERAMVFQSTPDLINRENE